MSREDISYPFIGVAICVAILVPLALWVEFLIRRHWARQAEELSKKTLADNPETLIMWDRYKSETDAEVKEIWECSAKSRIMAALNDADNH